MRRGDDASILYRTGPDNEPAPAAAMDAEPSDADEEFGDTYPAYGDHMRGISLFVSEYVREKLAQRDARIAKLEAQVETLIALIGKSNNLLNSKSADVVELPPFLRRTHDPEA